MDKNVTRTKWVFCNKLNEDGDVTRNTARLVCKCYSQVDDIDFEESFSLKVRIEAIRMFLAFVSYKNFKLYEVDVKSTLLNGGLEEEVYIEQLDGFQLLKDLDMVYKLKKALYGLNQPPWAWYVRLDIFLLQENFKKGTKNNNLYFKVESAKLLIVVVYIDDIIFGADKYVCKKFVEEMQK